MILSDWRRVAFVEDFYDILKEVHCQEKGHTDQNRQGLRYVPVNDCFIDQAAGL